MLSLKYYDTLDSSYKCLRVRELHLRDIKLYGEHQRPAVKSNTKTANKKTRKLEATFQKLPALPIPLPALPNPYPRCLPPTRVAYFPYPRCLPPTRVASPYPRCL
jgi:hypothetical protein